MSRLYIVTLLIAEYIMRNAAPRARNTMFVLEAPYAQVSNESEDSTAFPL